MGLGLLLGLAASGSWAITNVYVQRAGRAVGPVRALLWAQLMGAVALGLAAACGLDPRTAPVRAADLGWLALGGGAALCAYLGMFDAFARGSLSVVVPIMSSWSLIAAIFAVLVFGERLRPLQTVGGLLVVSGVLVVSRFAHAEANRATEQRSGAEKPRGWLLSVFGAALGFGVLIPIVDRLAPAFGRLGAIACVFLTEIALGLPFALAFRISLAPPSRELGRRAWTVLAAAGFFETAGFVCISLAGQRAPVAIVSPLSSIASPLTVLFAWFWLRERPAPAVLLGAALACAGVITLAF